MRVSFPMSGHLSFVLLDQRRRRKPERPKMGAAVATIPDIQVLYT